MGDAGFELIHDLDNETSIGEVNQQVLIADLAGGGMYLVGRVAKLAWGHHADAVEITFELLAGVLEHHRRHIHLGPDREKQFESWHETVDLFSVASASR